MSIKLTAKRERRACQDLQIAQSQSKELYLPLRPHPLKKVIALCSVWSKRLNLR